MIFILIATLVVFGVGFVMTQVAVREATKNYSPIGEFIEVEGKKVHFLRVGPKGAKPLLLIHGAHGSIYDYEKTILNSLAKKYDVLVYDRPGLGYSEHDSNKDLDIFDQAKLAYTLSKKLNMKKPLVVGHSFGAAVALALAANYPEDIQGLVLISPYIIPYDTPADPIHYIPVIPIFGKIFMHTWFQPLIKKFLSEKFLEKVFSPEPVHLEYGEVIKALALRPKNYIANARDIRNFGPGLKTLRKKLREIKQPIVTFFGARDPVAAFGPHQKYFEAYLPKTKFIALENVGHQPKFSHGDKIVQVINEFVEVEKIK